MSSTATDPNEPKRLAMQAWCDATRAILGGQVKTKRRGLWQQKVALEAAVTGAKLPELSDAEWSAMQAAPDEMNLAAKQPGPNDAIAATHRTGGVAAAETVEALVATSRARAVAFAALDTARVGTLDATGQGKLRQLDAPGPALELADTVRRSIDDAERDARALGPYLPEADRDAAVDRCRRLVAALDLDAAQREVEGFGKTIAALRTEAAEVQRIQAALPKLRSSDLPVDLAAWRRLNALSARRIAVRDAVEATTVAAQALADKIVGLPNPKRQQMDDLLPRLDAALKNWVKLPLNDMLSLATNAGSVPWMEQVLDRLLAPVSATAAEAQAAREAIEWTRFETEVQGFWAAFAASGFQPALRGPFGTKAVRTAYVKGRLAAAHNVTLAGRSYRVASSDTSGVSLHATYPEPPGGYPYNVAGQQIRSFVYHL